MNGLNAKLKRYASRHMYRDPLPNPARSIVTFGFDDCPRSVLETALPILEAEGWRATIYVAVGLCDTTNHLGLHLSENDIIEISDRGHEIAGHTYSHCSASVKSTPDFLADIERNQKALKDLGIPESPHFAYPFGHTTPEIKLALSNRFSTARGVIPSDKGELDSNLLNAMPIYSGGGLIDKITSHLPALQTQPEWLHLYGHDVRENPSDFGCTVDDFLRVVTSIKNLNLDVQTTSAAYEMIKRSKRLAA